jgi:hypothetical protein
MDTPITVDLADDGPCNLRCGLGVGDRTFCAGYPACVAGGLHRIQRLFGRLHTVHTVARPERRRSAQGGYSQTRIFTDPQDGTTIEQVELHCQTLQFESLLKRNPDGSAVAATPASEKRTGEVELHDPGF